MRRFGFTLAEVLITLGIIGIVAAMTIPTLITEHQKRTTVTKLQRAISVINQAYKLSYDELGDPTTDDILVRGPEYVFNTYWAPYVKVLAYCKTYDICGYTSKLPFKTLTNRTDAYQLTPDANITFWTMDGFVYSSQVAGYANGGIIIDKNRTFLIDLNGNKKPNRLGKDVFFLSTKSDGQGVVPRGHEETDDVINEDCSYEGRGAYCLEKIRRAGWNIEKDYPWK